MQEENPPSPNLRPLSYGYSFSLKKPIRTWQDFASTFRSVSFEESLNHASSEEIEAFWKNQLELLLTEAERICILVPAELTKSEANDGNSDLKSDGYAEKGGNKTQNKQKSKGKKAVSTPKVPINKDIVEIAMKLVTSSYPLLDYDFASLFLGNEKQLLIFRKCYAIESYIQKYRLPGSFKEPLQRLSFLADEFHNLKVERNRAISTLDQKLIEKLSEKIKRLNDQISKQMADFSLLWKEILLDFRSKDKCRDLLLNNINAEMIEILRPYCHQCETEIIDRFSECQSDQYKDILVVKKEDTRLIPVDQQVYDDREEQTQYMYIVPEKLKQPPMDIRNIEFVRVDFEKRCYTYRLDFRYAEEWNKPQGVFIRSEFGQSSYELNIDLPQECKGIDVDIYPYCFGKVSYEIYIWNATGFTKSTEKIVLFNELEPYNQKRTKTKNRSVYLLGNSDYGLKYSGNEGGNEKQMVLFPFNAKDLSIKSGAIICDEAGEVATWGEMYYPSQDDKEAEEEEKMDQSYQNNYRIQTPFLALSGKKIRKVSCGNGYCLMLSIFGSIYSVGTNYNGQLGLGNFNEGITNIEPHEICKFTTENSPFIVDIKASSTGASFAINSKGQLYRWGFNQVSTTDFPIIDRFGSIINYTSVPIIYKECDPSKISKCYIQEPIKQIQAGNGFYYALSQDGVLYGWGLCKYLGINQLLDLNEKIVIDIVNPIVIMKNIAFISANFDHTIAITTDNKVLAWGNSDNFSDDHQKYMINPVDITAQLDEPTNIKAIKAGRSFTAIITQQNKLKLIGKTQKFIQKEYCFNFDVTDIVCGDEELIGILAFD